MTVEFNIGEKDEDFIGFGGGIAFNLNNKSIVVDLLVGNRRLYLRIGKKL